MFLIEKIDLNVNLQFETVIYFKDFAILFSVSVQVLSAIWEINVLVLWPIVDGLQIEA